MYPVLPEATLAYRSSATVLSDAPFGTFRTGTLFDIGRPDDPPRSSEDEVKADAVTGWLRQFDIYLYFMMRIKVKQVETVTRCS